MEVMEGARKHASIVRRPRKARRPLRGETELCFHSGSENEGYRIYMS